MKRLLTAIAGVSLLAAAPVAQAAEASRASAPMDEASAMGGENSTLLWILAAIAVGVGLYLIIDDGNSDSP